LARRPIAEQLAAIELVLVHEFDEPYVEPLHAPASDAQQVREGFVIEATGITAARRVRTDQSEAFTEADLRLPAAA